MNDKNGMENTWADLFASSINLENHPMIKVKVALRTKYFMALEYFVKKFSDKADYTDIRLAQYRKVLINDKPQFALSDQRRQNEMRSIINNPVKPWRRKYRYWLLCDIALMLLDDNAIQRAYSDMKRILSRKQTQSLNKMLAALYNDEDLLLTFSFVESQIKQFRANRKFMMLPTTRIMVTATMSAGKSTLINALVGKKVSRVRAEACTAKVHEFYSKPYEDGLTLKYDAGVISATLPEILIKENECNMASTYMRLLNYNLFPFCLIDTPGVNSSRFKEHSVITSQAIKEGYYDLIIYVINACYVATKDDFHHLRFIKGHLDKKPKPIIFIVNQMDEFQGDASKMISSLRENLMDMGFTDPMIYPISARGAYFIKAAKYGDLPGDRRSKALLENYIADYKETDLRKLSTDKRCKNQVRDDIFEDREQREYILTLEQCGITLIEDVIAEIALKK